MDTFSDIISIHFGTLSVVVPPMPYSKPLFGFSLTSRMFRYLLLSAAICWAAAGYLLGSVYLSVRLCV